MNYDNAVQALRREKELLDKIFCLSEYQFRLIQSRDVDGFEAFCPLLGEPMAELAEAEEAVDASMAELDDSVLTPYEQRELAVWSQAIADLAHRIADIDEETAACFEAEKFTAVSAS
jgi:hypothetical protein